MSGIFDTFGGSIKGDVLTFKPDAMPEPDTLRISMTRGESRIADELRKQFGGFERVIIDVDGERHEFNADSLIRLLESYEGASRWHDLLGTPERAAQLIADNCEFLSYCGQCWIRAANCDGKYSTVLEWLRGDA